jgi:hypothetical protein
LLNFVGYSRVACSRSWCSRFSTRSLLLDLFIPVNLPEQLLKLHDKSVNLTLLLLTVRQPMR